MADLSSNNEVEKWVANIRRGDEEAFEYLFKAYYEKLSRFAWRYVKSKSIAEELVQEVFTNIWENRAEWKPLGVRAYLYSAVKNRAIDHLRHEQVKDEYDSQWREPENFLGSINDFEKKEQKKRIREALKNEIEALPPRGRMAFKLSRYDGLTYKEIAEVMEISVKTVESQIRRALKRLRTNLSALYPFMLIAICLLLGR